jgi:hypothetical protein
VRGRARFSENEADEIRSILWEVRRAERSKQKGLRARLRSKGFYISDWSSDQSKFSVSDFDEAVAEGLIVIGTPETEPRFPEGVSSTQGPPKVSGYEILEPLGRGGMGEVFRAKDLNAGSIVAVKVVLPELSRNPEFRRRFERESELASSISDAHVVRVRESGETPDGVLYLAMDLIDGTDLQALIDAGGRLSVDKALPLLRGTAAGLDAIHAGGLVHRDMKPGNVLVRLARPSQAFVSDFGLARSIEAASALTASGSFMGTLDYASPEQVSGDGLDARSDVYSLACVFFHALVGSPPFGDKDTAAKLYAHVHESPPSIGGRGDAELDLLEDVFDRALEKDPRRRYPSAGDFFAAFESASTGEANTRKERFVGTGDAAPGNAKHATRALPGGNDNRARWLTGVGVAIVLCLVAATAFSMTQGSGRDDSTGEGVQGPQAPQETQQAASGLGSMNEDASGEEQPDPVLFGAPVEGAKASVGETDGTKETVVASYCSPTGDFCHSVADRSGEVILSMGQFPFDSDRYRICVIDPTRTRECETFQWSEPRNGYYTGEVTLLDNFAISEPGTYRAFWTADGYKVGKPLEFRMLPTVPGDVVGPGEISGYITQLGSFRTEVEAQALRSELSSNGFTSSILRSSQYGKLEPGYWVVFSGPFSTQEEADESASSSGIDGAFGRPID